MNICTTVKRWKIYLGILSLPLLGGIAARLLRIVIAFMLRDAGISVFEITILFSSFMLSRAIFSPIIGRFADSGARRYMIIILGFIGLMIDAFLYTMVPYPAMFVLRIMDGIYGAMVWPTMQAIVHLSSPGRMRARIMSFYFVMGSVGMAIGYIFYSILMGNLLYAIFLVMAVYSINIAMSFSFKSIDNKPKKIQSQNTIVILNPFFYILTFMFGMYLSLGNEVLLFYLTIIVHMSRVDATLVLSVASMLALGGSIFLSHVADRHGVIVSLLLLSIISPISAVFLSINSTYLILIGIFLFFIAGRSFMPISRSFTATSGKKIGTALGFTNLSSNLGSVISPLIGGAMLDTFGSVTVGFFNVSGLIFILISSGITITTLLFFYHRK